MQGLNRITLVGNVGNDCELSFTPGGAALLKLRLAVNERVKRGEQWSDLTSWFTVAIWGKRAEALSKLIAKGTAVLVEGPMRQHNWEDKGGGKREAFEVNADNVILLGGGKRHAVARQEERRERNEQPPADDDIPF